MFLFIAYGFCIAQEDVFSLIIKSGKLIESIKNPTIKKGMKHEFETILFLHDSSKKIKRLKNLIFILKKTVTKFKETKALHRNFGIGKEVEALNFLTKYACILYDLNGKGLNIVRKELIQNLNTAKLSNRTKSLVRRLAKICDEGQKTLNNIDYIYEDDKDAKTELIGKNLGKGAIKSIMLGDPLPLIIEGIKTVKDIKKLNKKKSRQLDVIIHGYKSLLNNFLFELNLLKSDYIADYDCDQKQFITKESYIEFRNALLFKDKRKITALKKVILKTPNFREPLYYIALHHMENNNYSKAEMLLKKIKNMKRTIVHNDSFMGAVYRDMALLRYLAKDYAKALTYNTKALQTRSTEAVIYNNRSICYMYLNKSSQALKDIKKAIELKPDIAHWYWTKARIYSYCFNNDEKTLDSLEVALSKGFNNFAKIRKFKKMQRVINSSGGKRLMKPLLSAKYLGGIFNDDILIYNKSPYDINNIKLKLCVQYWKEYRWNKVYKKAEVKVLCNNSKNSITFHKIFNMLPDSSCKITLTYTSDQSAEPAKTQVLYNYEDKRMHKFFRDPLIDTKVLPKTKIFFTDLNKILWNNYEKELNSHIKHLNLEHLSLYKNRKAFNTLAAIYGWQGNREKAIYFMKKALPKTSKRVRLLLRKIPPKKVERFLYDRDRYLNELAYKLWGIYMKEEIAKIGSDELYLLSKSNDRMHRTVVAAIYAWTGKNKLSKNFVKNSYSTTPRRIELLLKGHSPNRVEKLLKNEINKKRMPQIKGIFCSEDMGNWGGDDELCFKIQGINGAIYDSTVTITTGSWQKSYKIQCWKNDKQFKFTAPSKTFAGKKVIFNLKAPGYSGSKSWSHQCGTK